MDFDQLFATAGQVLPPVASRRTGGLSSYAEQVRDEALASFVETPDFLRPPLTKETRFARDERLQALALYRMRAKKVKPNWDVKVHHVLDLDPIRDRDEEEVHGGRSSLVMERIDDADRTLFDGLPTEVVMSQRVRPLKGDGRRSLAAEAIIRLRQKQEGAFFPLPD